MQDWPTMEEVMLKTAIHRISLLGEVVVSGSMHSVKVDGKRIDFWPGSNTYYLHSKSKYGHGILQLLALIDDFRRRTNPAHTEQAGQ